MDANLYLRSDAPNREPMARRPYRQVHVVRTSILDDASMHALSGCAYKEAGVSSAGDVSSASARDDMLHRAAPSVPDLHARIAAALVSTGAFGTDSAWCLRSVEEDTDFLVSAGAGFHNDTDGHWPSCLFWLLVLDATEAQFVVPDLNIRHRLVPGDLLVFDPSLAHGIGRQQDAGRVVLAHFDVDDSSGDAFQSYLGGEVVLNAARWSALDCPWLPAHSDCFAGAVNLRDAEFDPETGVVRVERSREHQEPQ